MCLPKGQEEAPCIPPSATNGCFVKRIVPGDNSCLFHCLAYVLHDKSRTMGPAMREHCGSVVLENSKKFTPTLLGMSNENYYSWIHHKDTSGGAIELRIMSDEFQVEIVAFDLQTCREDHYGQDMNYARRCFLCYSGKHYDVLALSAHVGAPESEDQVLFNSTDLSVYQKAQAFIEEENRKCLQSEFGT